MRAGPCRRGLTGLTSFRSGGRGLLRPAAAGWRGLGRLDLRFRLPRFRLVASDLAEAEAFGEFGALGGVRRGDHRVIVRQAPLLAVLVGGEAAGAEVPLERLVGLAVLQADDVVRRHRPADRNRGRGLLDLGRWRCGQLRQCCVGRRNETRQLGCRNVVPRDIGADDGGGETDKIGILLYDVIHVPGPTCSPLCYPKITSDRLDGSSLVARHQHVSRLSVDFKWTEAVRLSMAVSRARAAFKQIDRLCDPSRPRLSRSGREAASRSIARWRLEIRSLTQRARGHIAPVGRSLYLDH